MFSLADSNFYYLSFFMNTGPVFLGSPVLKPPNCASDSVRHLSHMSQLWGTNDPDLGTVLYQLSLPDRLSNELSNTKIYTKNKYNTSLQYNTYFLKEEKMEKNVNTSYTYRAILWLRFWFFHPKRRQKWLKHTEHESSTLF